MAMCSNCSKHLVVNSKIWNALYQVGARKKNKTKQKQGKKPSETENLISFHLFFLWSKLRRISCVLGWQGCSSPVFPFLITNHLSLGAIHSFPTHLHLWLLSMGQLHDRNSSHLSQNQISSAGLCILKYFRFFFICSPSLCTFYILILAWEYVRIIHSYFL